MKRLFIASLAVSAITIGVASAADLPVKAPPMAPPVVPVYNWTGFYIGGNGGGAWSRDDYSFDNGALTVENFNFNPNSWIAGGQIGYQFQSPNNVVLGMEGTWSATDLNQTDSSVKLTNINGPFQRSLKVDEIATVTAKLGFVAWPSTMVYGKVGYAWGHMKYNSDDLIGITSSTSNWGGGVTFGGGVDYRVYNNIILGAELDYYHIGSSDVSTGTNPAGFTVAYNNPHAYIFTAVARISYLFNWGPNWAP